MKKLFILLMVLVLAVTCVACGGGSDETTTAAPSGDTTTGEATTTTPTTTTKPVETTTAPPVTTTEATTTTQAPADELDISIFKTALSLTKPANKVPASSYEVWDGTVAAAFAGGTGTKEDPYLISNGAELAYLAYLVNNTEAVPNPDAVDGSLMIKDNPTANLYYKLTQDIYLNDVTDISAWDDDPMTVPAGVNAWTPIGLQAANTNDATTRDFQGHFDGAGFTVYGLYVSQEYYYAGLFGKIVGNAPVPEGTPEGTVIEQIDTYEEWAEATVEDVPAGVSNLTIAYSVVNGYYYVGAVSGYGTRAYFDNCVVDDTVTTIIVGRAANKGGVAGVVGRMQGLIEDCTSSATVLAHIHAVEKDPENGDTTLIYPYPQFTGGVASVMVGIMSRCANFGDVSTYVIGGLLTAYIGGDSIGSCAYDCLVEGTLRDGWVGKYDPEIAERRVIARCGILVCRTAHVDAPVDYNVQRCVSAGKYAEDFDTSAVTAIGRVAGQNQGWVGTKDILYVNTGFPEEMAITGDWDSKASFIWTNIYEITPEQYAEYRAQAAQ